MSGPEVEEINLELDDLPAHQRRLEHAKSRTANLVAVILVCGLILALVLYTLSAWINEDFTERLQVFYEKWLGFLSPFVGMALGFYFGSEKRRQR